MNAELVVAALAGFVGDAHLGDGGAGRAGVAAQQPGRLPLFVALRTDHDVAAVDGLHQLIEGCTPGAGQRDQLVEADAPVPGLDPAQLSDLRQQW
ncbi:hypothetical protein [Streptomyces sp. PTD9-10]|uniref:hypothetical protein n=1 Tax=Streptomyces sp. PTD9-10 TaxID=3120151 RepID=UPI00300891F9